MDEIKFDFSLPWGKFKEVYAWLWLNYSALHSRWYYANNREKERLRRKKYREKNRQELNNKAKQIRRNNLDKIRLRDREYYKKNKAKRLEDKKRYYNLNREKVIKQSVSHSREKWYWAVHAKTDREIKKRWIRPKKCTICGDWGKIYAHHPDYSEWNKVIFVCGSCHSQIHNWIKKCPEPIDILSFKVKENAINKHRVAKWEQIWDLW